MFTFVDLGNKEISDTLRSKWLQRIEDLKNDQYASKVYNEYVKNSGITDISILDNSNLYSLKQSMIAAHCSCGNALRR